MDPRLQIRSFISETFFVEEFADADSFLRTGIVDSTGMLELVAFVERTFSIRIADPELIPENLDSLDNLCRFIGQKVAAQAA